MTKPNENKWALDLDNIDIEGMIAKRAARPKGEDKPLTHGLCDFSWEFTLTPQHWDEARKEKAKEN